MLSTFIPVEEYARQMTRRVGKDEQFSEKLVHDIASFAACELLSRYVLVCWLLA